MLSASENTPMRILMVTGILDRGGAETMIMNLYRKMDRSKIQFDFVEHSLVPGAFDDEITALGGVIYHRSRLNGLNYLEYKKWWNDFFNNHPEYRIIHGHIESMAAVYLSIAKEHGLYTIAHSHSINSRNIIKQIVFDIVTYKTRYISDHLFACSYEAGKSRYGKEFCIPSTKCTILHNSIDVDKYLFDNELRKETRTSLGIRDTDFVIGHVGRFVVEKNHDFLLNVFREISKTDQNTRLLLVGDGELRSTIEEKAKSADVYEKTIFVGVQENTAPYYMAMDCMVFPSIVEGLPLTLVEAQTASLPCVISSNIPSDCVLVDDLLDVLSLNEKVSVWANAALSSKQWSRRSERDIIRKKGFDTSNTAEWLTEFYYEKTR